MDNLLQVVQAQIALRKNKTTFYATMFPELNAELVNTVVRKLSDKDPTEIMTELNALKYVNLPEDLLRACAVSMAQRYQQPDLNVVSVPGDGNCLFHAVLKCMRNVHYTAAELRKFVVYEMRGQFADMTMKFLEVEFGTNQSSQALLQDYTNSMLKGRWGGHIELTILAHLLQTEIQVWVSFEEYAHQTKSKDPADRQVLQVSTYANYVLLSSENCFGVPANNAHVLRLLFSEGNHYDCLAQTLT
jgi:hypothetical protein